MVRWLVEQEEVPFYQGENGERHAAPFTAGEGVESLGGIITGEEETTEKATCLADGQVGLREDHIQDRLSSVQSLLLLAVDDGSHPMAEDGAPPQGSKIASDRIQQGRLPTAILTDDCDPLAAIDHQIRAREECGLISDLQIT